MHINLNQTDNFYVNYAMVGPQVFMQIDNAESLKALGKQMHQTATELWPICRSLTGKGVRETLVISQKVIPNLQVHEVPSGTKCFDWTVPEEWNISDAYIKDPKGNKIVDFKSNNLHVVGYSRAVHQKISLKDLQEHLFSLPELPTAIPYVTSYYRSFWGFCLTENQRRALPDGEYEVVIDSRHHAGSMTYGEIFIPGVSKNEVLLSTYICHPSMGNNELSGPVVTLALAQWLQSQKDLKYSYRILFVPETIGSIAYLSMHLEQMKKSVKAGFVVTCVGDERAHSYLPSRNGDTLADRAALCVLRKIAPAFKSYTYLDRGSDERQYCSPGVDLPVCSMMRSKYGEYQEYHTSLDNLELITPAGLAGGFEALQKAIWVIEKNCVPKAIVKCEPQLGKRGLYPNLSVKGSADQVANMMNLLAYADGEADLLKIAQMIKTDFFELLPICETLNQHQLLELL